MLPLRAMYRRAASRGEIAVNPTTGLEMPAVRDGRDRIASPDECAGLLEALAEADRPLWATAMYAGLRRGELMALRVEDIDLAAGVIHVRRRWTGGLVFGATSLSPFSPTPVRRRAAVAWKNAGLQAITLHECRHTFASLMIAAGVNAKALSTYMGHANISITLDRYGHLMPGNEDGWPRAYLTRIWRAKLRQSRASPVLIRPDSIGLHRSESPANTGNRPCPLDIWPLYHI